MFRNLDERYEHVGSLGSGGMSTVYKARDKLLDRIVAIKQLKGELVSEDMLQRFEREAKAYAALKHRNIVSVFDFGTDEHNKPFLVMDFVEGTSLDEVIARGAMEPALILAIFIELLEGLDHAHKKSIVHRDLKPANVMVSEVVQGENSGPRIKLLDFGIAKMETENGGAGEAFRTQAGLVMGSPLYMSPEQAEGSSLVDARSDIYSVGCMLYEVLTGRPPFRGENFMKTIFAHRTGEIPDMTEAVERFGQSKDDIESIVRKALSKLPEQRYQTAFEMRDDLIRLQDKLKSSKEQRLGRQKQKALPGGVVTALVSILGLGALIGFAILFTNFIENYVDREGKRETAKAPVVKKSDIPSIKGDYLDYWRDYESQHKMPPGSSLKSLIGRQDVLTVSLGANLPDTSRHTPETRLAQLKILDGLEFLPKLDTIVLQNFTITEDDIRRFIKVRTIDTIEFRFCKIPKDTVEILMTNPRLKCICIKACDQITKRQIELLNSTNFPNLKTLNLSTNDLNWADSLKPISTLSKVTYLDLQQTRITAKHLWSLVKMRNLTRVNVGNNELDDEACKVMSHMTQLKSLEIGYTERITDAGVKELTKLRRLERLCLEWVPMTDSGLLSIATLPMLKSLEVPGCQKITAQGLAKLKRQRPQLAVKDTLTTLNIDGNSFGTIYDPD